ncbi:quinol monooxygenase YgiN [Paraburkholderia sp. GAS333]|uniref:putative quinol monooxygenase n=1 Tax=Paraburkholderia sp. GAS333 TaxID=3156279 RepID=UPI003D1FF5DF
MAQLCSNDASFTGTLGAVRRFPHFLFTIDRDALRMKIFLAASIVASVALSGAASAAEVAKSASPLAIYAVVHVDIEPKDLKTALPLLQSFEQQAAHDTAVVSIDVLQQMGAENHFTLLEKFSSAAGYDDFVSRPYVKALRSGLQPLLGGPFDERIHRAMPQTQ